MSKRSISGKGGNVRGRALSWMALAVCRSRSMRVSASAIHPLRALTVSLMPSESEENSSLPRASTRTSRLPSVIFAREAFVSLMGLTTIVDRSLATRT